jgi:hypothetical protein
MRSEANSPKNVEPTVGFSFTMLQHTGSVLVKDFLAKISVKTLEHPPYFSDLAAANFYLFFRPKSALKGRRDCDATDIITNATEELKRLSERGLQECFQHLYGRWQKCVVAQGNHFEVAT